MFLLRCPLGPRGCWGTVRPLWAGVAVRKGSLTPPPRERAGVRVAPAPLRRSAARRLGPGRSSWARPAGGLAFSPRPCLWGPWLPAPWSPRHATSCRAGLALTTLLTGASVLRPFLRSAGTISSWITRRGLWPGQRRPRLARQPSPSAPSPPGPRLPDLLLPHFPMSALSSEADFYRQTPSRAWPSLMGRLGIRCQCQQHRQGGFEPPAAACVPHVGLPKPPWDVLIRQQRDTLLSRDSVTPKLTASQGLEARACESEGGCKVGVLE